MEATVRNGWTDERGMTLIELLMVMVMLAILLGIGFQGLQAFNQSAIPDRAATAIAGDVTLTRSYAIQRGEDITFAADEANRSYEIRTASGDVLHSRSFSASTDLPLTMLDVTTGSDEFTFNSRGMLAGGVSSVTIDIARFDTGRRIQVNALGRTRINTP